jgi:hypothetical protein
MAQSVGPEFKPQYRKKKKKGKGLCHLLFHPETITVYQFHILK